MPHRPSACHNLFFALRPPPVLARRIAAAAEMLGQGSQRPDRLHVTLFILRGLAEVDPALMAALRRIGGAVRLAPFAVTFDRVVGSDGYVALRPSRRDAALAGLRDRLIELARAAGLAPAELPRFNPHISLIYRGGRSVNERIAPVGWRADELLLIDSHVGATWHEERGRWPLVAAPAAQLSLL